MAGGDERVGIEVNLDDHVSVPARTAAEGLDGLGDEAKEAERRLRALQRQADKTGRSLEFLAVKNRAAQMSFNSVGERASYVADEFKRLTDEYKKNQKAAEETERQAGRMERTFRRFVKTMGQVRSVVARVAKGMFGLGLAFAAVGAAALAAQLIPQILGIGHALASLLALSALAPAGVGALAAIFGGLALAFHGLGDAISDAASGDWTKFAQDMEKLSPAARSFVMQIVELLPILRQFQQMIQQNVFAPIAKNFTRVFNNLWPVLFMGMRRVAEAIGVLFDEFGKFLASSDAADMLNTILDGTVQLLHGIAATVAPLGKGLADVARKAGPFWTRFVVAVAVGLANFGRWLSQISQDGRLEKWLNAAFETAKDLWSIVRSIVRVFAALGATGAEGALKGLAKAFESFAGFLENPKVQKAMKDFFDGLPDVAEIAWVLAGALLAIGALASPIGLVVIGLFAIGKFISAFKEELKGIGRALGRVFTDDNERVLDKLKTAWETMARDVIPWVRKTLESFAAWLNKPETQQGLKDFADFTSSVLIPTLGILAKVIVFAVLVAFTLLIDIIGFIGRTFKRAVLEMQVFVAFLKVGVDKLLKALALYYEFAPASLGGNKKTAAQIRESQKEFDDWADHVITRLDDIANPDRFNLPPLYMPPDHLNPNSPEGGRWMGGPVAANTRYTVGEIGKELYVPNVGAPSLIGVGGQETRSFPTAGTIIPNHLLDAFSGVESGMRAHAETVAAQVQSAGRGRGSGGPTVVHGNTYQISVDGGPHLSADDIADKVGARIRRIERDRAERH